MPWHWELTGFLWAKGIPLHSVGFLNILVDILDAGAIIELL
jgi:hypothetical protein